MGNWRTVNLVGTVDPGQVDPLREQLAYTWETLGDDRFGPLSFNPSTPSLCGLGDWVRPPVFACGNLAERDYSVQAVADHLRDLLAVAPSLTLKAHCGGDWESTDCVATITVTGGRVTVGPAEVPQVGSVSEQEGANRLLRAVIRARGPGGTP